MTTTTPSASPYLDVLTAVTRELNANYDNSDAHTRADIADDVVRMLVTTFKLDWQPTTEGELT